MKPQQTRALCVLFREFQLLIRALLLLAGTAGVSRIRGWISSAEGESIGNSRVGPAPCLIRSLWNRSGSSPAVSWCGSATDGAPGNLNLVRRETRSQGHRGGTLKRVLIWSGMRPLTLRGWSGLQLPSRWSGNRLVFRPQ